MANVIKRTPRQPSDATHTAGDYIDRVQLVDSAGGVVSSTGAQTSGGLTGTHLISAATTNATSAKGSAGQVYAFHVTNVNAATRYFKLYNKATAPTVGTDTPVATVAIPPASATTFSTDVGIAFPLGIGFALTTGIAVTDTGAVSASEHAVNLFYK